MFSDPLVLTVSGSAKSMNRTGTDVDRSFYATADRAFRAVISHSYGKRTRRMFKTSSDTLVANPLIAGQNVSQTASVHTVVDAPPGYDTTLLKGLVDAHVANLAASSGANVTKLLGGES